MNRLPFSAALLCATLFAAAAFGQPEEANYDEAKVPKYTLPDPLVLQNGERVSDAAAWREKRRPEILELFRTHVYGRTPSSHVALKATVNSTEKALDGKAVRKQVTVSVSAVGGDGAVKALDIHLLVYLPADAKQPVPAFLGLNFSGNQTIHSDPGIAISSAWIRNRPEHGVVDNRATEKSRGAASGRWQAELVLSRGYALATAYYGDIDPDFDDGFANGAHPLFYKAGQTKPAEDEWGSIGAWAWGLSMLLNALELDPDIDAKRVAVLGHSRLGKTALWAGAQDERFALVISNDSGCGGAALSRRAFGETVKRINTSFPHWFCDNFNRYNDNEGALPVDQHMLVALMAPRPVYIASAQEDRWADPRGEYLSAYHAAAVYKLLGLEGLPADEMPAIDSSVQGTIGYHIRTGKHDVTEFDWLQYLAFADKHLRRQ
jgi:hypothetical protein